MQKGAYQDQPGQKMPYEFSTTFYALTKKC